MYTNQANTLRWRTNERNIPVHALGVQWACIYVYFNQTTAIRKTLEDLTKKSNVFNSNSYSSTYSLNALDIPTPTTPTTPSTTASSSSKSSKNNNNNNAIATTTSTTTSTSNSNSVPDVISDKVDIYFKHVNVRLNDDDIYVIVNLIRAKLNILRKPSFNNKKQDRMPYVNLKNLKRIFSKVYDSNTNHHHEHSSGSSGSSSDSDSESSGNNHGNNHGNAMGVGGGLTYYHDYKHKLLRG